ncbi:hypothetical protein HPB49_018034 [Dermacentor silvarum]|uniref:Uncharacterized protein n=1 Tax=Dermacentor silvarum TaxID=543639 RepID=A0ACB8DQ49_DERSI|nr:hypothetical protein HPB49_018034 [Dermacentor silvarum]
MCITRKLQLTLAILKPDVCKIPMKLEAVRQVILENDFIFVKSKMGSYTREQMEKFYAEHQGKFFFERLASFMSSGPLSVHVLAKENGIKEWRTLLGPTQVFRFGLTDTRNAGHGSDSEESARREIGFFFPEFDQDMWYLNEEQRWRRAKLVFDLERCEHVVVDEEEQQCNT